MFKVMRERCDQCLYGPNKIVSNERRADIIRKLNKQDKFFECHKSTLVGEHVACRGDYDQRECGQLGQVAKRLGCVEFVDEADLGREKGTT